VVVAVVDSGIDYNHPDLIGNLWANPSMAATATIFVSNTNNPLDDFGHGTHIAGTIAAWGTTTLA